jgi:hypothetical protein
MKGRAVHLGSRKPKKCTSKSSRVRQRGESQEPYLIEAQMTPPRPNMTAQKIQAYLLSSAASSRPRRQPAMITFRSSSVRARSVLIRTPTRLKLLSKLLQPHHQKRGHHENYDADAPILSMQCLPVPVRASIRPRYAHAGPTKKIQHEYPALPLRRRGSGGLCGENVIPTVADVGLSR